MRSYMILAVLALATSTASPALSAPTPSRTDDGNYMFNNTSMYPPGYLYYYYYLHNIAPASTGSGGYKWVPGKHYPRGPTP
jgi:hypothetical protein